MHLPEEETLITEELRVLRAQAGELKANLEAIWASSESRAEYELTSVFIHRGTSPTFGHYFFYARNLPDHPDQWFKYNDAEVTEVGKDEVFADTTGQTANPYLVNSIIDFHSPFSDACLACLCTGKIKNHQHRQSSMRCRRQG